MTTSPEPIHVAVAVISNDKSEVLLSLRAKDAHQGDLWEFPGGKVEEGESLLAALHRECHEELGLTIELSRPLIRILHDYGDRQVMLDVHKVDTFSGQAHGKEGQAMEWVAIDKLALRAMPEANRGIIQALLLPDELLVTPDIATDTDVFLQQLQHSLEAGVRLVQFRQTQLSDEEYINLAKEVQEQARQSNARVLLNHSLDMYPRCAPDGMHLNSQRLMALCERPVSMNTLLSASCHNLDEIKQANNMQVDFIIIGPVQATQTHPDATVLTWEGFQTLADAAVMPAYALGGMSPADKDTAFEHGAQGIAAIRSLWKSGA